MLCPPRFTTAPLPPLLLCSDSATTVLATMYSSKACQSGLYCPTGMTMPPDPVANACPLASYCPTAAALPVLCDPGTYANVTGLAACFTCPAGGLQG